MVAITVILAAVIGTFVLNLGGDLQQTPQAQIGVEGGDSTTEVNINHNGGDSININDLTVSFEDNSPVAFTDPGDGSFDVGDSVTYGSGTTGVASGEVSVQIIHTPSDSILVETTVTVP